MFVKKNLKLLAMCNKSWLDDVKNIYIWNNMVVQYFSTVIIQTLHMIQFNVRNSILVIYQESNFT